MSTVGIVLIHGRSQQMAAAERSDAARVQSHVAGLRRQWMSGLSRGLVLAGQPPIPDGQVFFPFYGNAFTDAIDARIAGGGGPPDLEAVQVASETRGELILELAATLNFDPALHISGGDETVATAQAAWQARQEGLEFQWDDLLRSTVVSSALSFIARKTGAAEFVIETFLSDVAYYLDVPEIRETVLDIVRDDVKTASQSCDQLVVVAHSLGTLVAYDLFAAPVVNVPVTLLVTAGSPLGLPVVHRNLLPGGVAANRPVPRIPSGPVPWLNAYDVRDVVALVHPLNGTFNGEIRDERTHNPSGAHSIEDYLADPDVAAPIGRAATHAPPW